MALLGLTELVRDPTLVVRDYNILDFLRRGIDPMQDRKADD
jgi:hypothetical protein